jgi:uncharacterized protein (PEP-CTERM system associated)
LPASRGNTGRDRAHKAQIHRVSAGFFCAFLTTLAVTPIPALAQTASSQTGGGAATQATPAAPFIAPIRPAERSLLNGAAGLARTYPTQGAGLVAPVAPAERRLLAGNIDLAEGYTTNANGGQGGSTGSPDTFTRGRLGLSLHYDSLRLKTEGHYSLSGDYYNRFHNLDRLANRLNLATTYEVDPDHLSVHVNAFAAPTFVSRVGPISASGATNSSNYQQSYGYVAEPVLRLRLGDYATSQTSVSENAVFFSRPLSSTTYSTVPITTAQNTNSITATERIMSEPYFGRLRWGLTGSYSDTRQTTQTLQQSRGTADIAYALDRVVALLATVGYSKFTSSNPLTQNPSGLIALAGFRYSIGPKFTLAAEAGSSNGFATYLGSLNWNPTPTFSIIGSMTDSVGLTQGNILNNLSTLATSAEGAFSYAQTDYLHGQQQSLNPQFATVSPIPTLGLALDNSVYHSRSVRLAFAHRDERNQYALSFFGNMRDRLSVTNDTTPSTSSLYGMSFTVSRKLRPDLTGHAGISYSLANEFSGQDRIFTADAGLTYTMAENLSTYITGRYLRRDSNGQIVNNVPVSNIESDFEAIVGVRRGF